MILSNSDKVYLTSRWAKLLKTIDQIDKEFQKPCDERSWFALAEFIGAQRHHKEMFDLTLQDCDLKKV